MYVCITSIELNKIGCGTPELTLVDCWYFDRLKQEMKSNFIYRKDEYDNWFDMPKLQLMELLGIDSRAFELYLLHLAALDLVIFKRVEYEDEYGETIPYVVYRVNREIIKEYL